MKFDISPTDQDKENIKNDVASFLEDRKDINKATAQEITIQGLKNTTDYTVFFEENSSDLPVKESYYMKDKLPKAISDDVMKG